MKNLILVTLAVLMSGLTFAQPPRGETPPPLPEGFKPASTNTFLAPYPAVNAETREVLFRVNAPTAQYVQVGVGGKRYDLTKDEKGYWMGKSDPQVVGFHYYSVYID